MNIECRFPELLPSIPILVAIGLMLVSCESDRDLIKITRQRMAMDERLLELCVGPEAVVGPHAVPEVDIYVNQAVLDYRKENPKNYDYPVGSRFVKKKYPDVGVKEPDIATIMVKTGMEGEVSDWEFSIIALPGGEALKHTGRISCAKCHERYEERGFVSRDSEKALAEFLGFET